MRRQLMRGLELAALNRKAVSSQGRVKHIIEDYSNYPPKSDETIASFSSEILYLAINLGSTTVNLDTTEVSHIFGHGHEFN